MEVFEIVVALLLRLRLEDDGSVDREVRLARVETLRAAVAASATCPGAETAALVRHRYDLQLRRAEEEFARDGADANGARLEEAAAAPPTAAEGCVEDGTIGDAAFQRVEEELDWAELDWAQLLRAGERADSTV